MKIINNILLLLGLALMAFSLTACSGSGRSSRPTNSGEVFEPDAYPDDPNPRQTTQHDVPETLMSTTEEDAPAETSVSSRPMNSGELVTAQGFRIQVMSSESKASADAAWQDAKTWWTFAKDSDKDAAEMVPAGDLEVYIVRKSPYYKVRVGNFTSREDADTFLAIIKRKFPDAWIVLDKIQFYR